MTVDDMLWEIPLALFLSFCLWGLYRLERAIDNAMPTLPADFWRTLDTPTYQDYYQMTTRLLRPRLSKYRRRQPARTGRRERNGAEAMRLVVEVGGTAEALNALRLAAMSQGRVVQ